MAEKNDRRLTVLVTGCSQGGLGFALSQAFANAGCRVFATARDPTKAASLVGDNVCEILPLDVTSKESIDACVSKVRHETGGKGLDILVNNAGIGLTVPLLDTSIDDAKRMFDVNVWGMLAVTQAFAPLLIEAKGVVLNISSVAGAVCMAWQGAYNSSKTAMTFLSETLRMEMRPLGVRVVTAMVGEVETEFYNHDTFSLPPDSHYKSIEAIIRKQSTGEMQVNNEKAWVTARNLVNDVLSGRSGQVWRGGVAGTVNSPGHSALEKRMGEQPGDDVFDKGDLVTCWGEAQFDIDDRSDNDDWDSVVLSEGGAPPHSSHSTCDLSAPPSVSIPENELDNILGLRTAISAPQPASIAAMGHAPYLPSPCNTPATITTPLARADLDELYFDRIHVFMPALQRRRYFSRSWREADAASQPYAGLQSAMWTLAAAMSSQFQQLCQPLYSETLQRLSHATYAHGLDGTTARLDLARAWILVAVYEFMHASFESAWASAGRAIRLVQLLRLNVIDASGADDDPDSFIEKEESRRTFWVAFCLDRFSCVLKGLPLTLGEQPICTRLPCPEEAFQSGKPVVMPFLSEVVAADAPIVVLSPFAESVIFTTLWGRTLNYQQLSAAQLPSCGISSTDIRDRQLQLNGLVSRRILQFQQTYSTAAVESDSMLLFTSIIAQTTVLAFCNAAEPSADSVPASDRFIDDVLGHQWRARVAAKEIARLADSHTQFSVFKV
ncbi:hypothetical protein DL766_009703 [Monosporascus sp. MC13-8B]|uniref:Xylanolytic transcriptional activator regulatory domain-containing protein n=1 Tax=Monosporascus cannonballus TaxID=155416 RepID=A0ABY0HDE4_9PEZI|nr:hypothetical protein DL762_002481 [Monosporascus cannonballus]RYO98937.1 hypothetical protein DL763_001847 [Monosporascus cannonballus]RYP14386.1 hypothetical protein DL766_009703 [Monosporascus sp. MC13-8B]